MRKDCHFAACVLVAATFQGCGSKDSQVNLDGQGAAGPVGGTQPARVSSGKSSASVTSTPSYGGGNGEAGASASTVGNSSSHGGTATSSTRSSSSPGGTTNRSQGGLSNSSSNTLAGDAGTSAAQAGAAGSTAAACLLPIDKGAVTGSLHTSLKYGYNTQTQRCESFDYTDLGGNDNRFDTLEACFQACDPLGIAGCGADSDCTFSLYGCCDACEPYEKADFHAVNVKYFAYHLCDKALDCGPCPAYDGVPSPQFFYTKCVERRCQVLDSREDPTAPCDPDKRAANNLASTHTLEIARAAKPDTEVTISIFLLDPGSSTSKSLDQRKAELAPTQAPIIAALAQIQATRIEPYFLQPSVIVANIQARYLRETLCWPAVASVSTDTRYWDAVERPWDVNSVGTRECSLVEGQCPEHCELVAADKVDPIGQCMKRAEPAACSIDEVQDHGTLGKCSARVSTGRAYCNMQHFVPREPQFLGWRDCTAEEGLQCSTYSYTSCQ